VSADVEVELALLPSSDSAEGPEPPHSRLDAVIGAGERIQRLLQLLDSLIAELPMGIALLDASERVVLSNRCFMRQAQAAPRSRARFPLELGLRARLSARSVVAWRRPAGGKATFLPAVRKLGNKPPKSAPISAIRPGMNARRQKPEPKTSSVSLLRVLGGVGTLALLVFYLGYASNFYVARSLMLLYGDLETTFKGARPTLSGGFTAHSVKLLDTENGAEVLRFERIEIDTPSLWWTLRSLFSRKASLHRAVEHWRIELTGAESPEGFPLALTEMMLVGAASAAPFEAQGCAEDMLWSRAELVQMGLTPGPTSYRFEFAEQGDRATLTEVIDTPGSARSTFVRSVATMRETNVLRDLGFKPGASIVADRYEFEDFGFVRARNRWCARKDKISPQVFVERHLAALARDLAAEGLRVADAAREAYRPFAERGGRLVLEGEYRERYPIDRYAEDSAKASATLWAAQIELDGKRTWVGFDTMPARPYAESDWEKTTVEVLAREGALPGVAPVLPAPATSAAAVDALTAVAPMTGSDGRATVPSVVATSPSPAVAAPTAPIAASSVALAPAPAASEEEWSPELEGRIAFEKLADYVGRTLEIASVVRPLRIAIVERVERDRVHLRVNTGGGYATYAVERKDFLYARAYGAR
jgi:hypothetical protein